MLGGPLGARVGAVPHTQGPQEGPRPALLPTVTTLHDAQPRLVLTALPFLHLLRVGCLHPRRHPVVQLTTGHSVCNIIKII